MFHVYDHHVLCHYCSLSAPLEQQEQCKTCGAVTCGCAFCFDLVETESGEIWCDQCFADVTPPLNSDEDEDEETTVHALQDDSEVEEEYDEKLYEQLLSHSTASAAPPSHHAVPVGDGGFA